VGRVENVVEDARLEESGSGLVPAADGWFVVDVAAAARQTNDAFGSACFFERADAPTRRSRGSGRSARPVAGRS
jgi:hypothetical protein